MMTGAEVVARPMLSVAVAVSVCGPALNDTVTEYGEATSTPIEAPLSKNSTLSMAPSSVAVALTVTGSSVESVEPLRGDVKATTGP